ncbi:type I secretion system permease/ATPase [Curtobacterium sp. Curtsp57]|uniref:type I secretion system permease/ATPase n=1 Tax=Curtobacterium sp. Curtsp57 TaxID=3243047 RepID=UPI0039B402E5
MAALLITSAVSNVLMLTGSLFMLQVYDRVLVSKSVPTLVALTVITAGLFAVYGIIEVVRGRIASGIADVFEDTFRAVAHERSALSQSPYAEAADKTAAADLAAVRGFVGGPAALAILDLPWVPLYLWIVFSIHITLGWIAVAGAVVITSLLILNQLTTDRGNSLHAADQRRSSDLASSIVTNWRSIRAMAMIDALSSRWSRLDIDVQESRRKSVGRTTAFTTTSKTVRMFLQSLILAVGAYLVIEGEMSSGLMLASSVVTSRALAPIEQTVGTWKSTSLARVALKRMRDWVESTTDSQGVQLPIERRTVAVRAMAAGPLRGGIPILRGIDFQVESGDAVAVIGPSGSGKTITMNALVGAWKLISGEVLYDGSPLDQYSPTQRARMIGYLPQQVELLDGTVGENISRFDSTATSDEIVGAALSADVHELIKALPDGYSTQIGAGGITLSGGQRQRIGLARAMFRMPFCIVLDEPNANLDHSGEDALSTSLEAARKHGSIVLVVSHRTAILDHVNKVLILNNGGMQFFGNKQDAFEQGSTVVPLTRRAAKVVA